MHFVTEAVPGEITLMFISYLLFCTVLMYLFVKTDREWGRLEVSLDEPGRRNETASASALSFSSADIGPQPMFADAAAHTSLRHCAEHHELGCACFLRKDQQEG